jgi:hypothetical protein
LECDSGAAPSALNHFSLIIRGLTALAIDDAPSGLNPATFFELA